MSWEESFRREIYEDMTLGFSDLPGLSEALKISDASRSPDRSGVLTWQLVELMRVDGVRVTCRKDVLILVFQSVTKLGSLAEIGISMNQDGVPMDKNGRLYTDPQCDRQSINEQIRLFALDWLSKRAQAKVLKHPHRPDTTP